MVTIIGARFPLVTSTPFKAPQTNPRTTAAISGKINPTGDSVFIVITQTTLASATIPPNDRSIPPVKMISVCPNATIKRGKEVLSRFLKFPIVKKSRLNTLTRSISATRNTYMITTCPCLFQKFLFSLFFILLSPPLSVPSSCPCQTA